MPSAHLYLLNDSITPELRRVLSKSQHPQSILGAGAKAVQIGVVRHLEALEQRGNKNGWPSQKFFAGGSDSVKRRVGLAALTDKYAEVTIADPRFIHRIEGGAVTPKRGKMLAIPMNAEAYSKTGKGSIRESFPDLVIIKTAKGVFLARPNKSGAVQVMFHLVPSATQKPHPEEMPDRRKLSEDARSAMLKAAKLMTGAK
jgi:hypothetical protein